MTSKALVIYNAASGIVLRTIIADDDNQYPPMIRYDIAVGEAYTFMSLSDPTMTPELAVLFATGLNPPS